MISCFLPEVNLFIMFEYVWGMLPLSGERPENRGRDLFC